ncbi:glycosyl hydrolase family 18 protein [Planctobacterium marinum]|uniref:Chitinase n=1 Tax=Planctobacterium marinum TaxID=1631968 RepID=A0AA48KT54_9ALTE|nr:chitinase [Planctobacterium marinum]
MTFQYNAILQKIGKATAATCCLLSSAVCANTWQTEVAVVGEEGLWWNNYTITISNTGNSALDLDDAQLSFQSQKATTAPNWSGTGISSPTLNASSTADNAVFSNSVQFDFEENSWTDSLLEPGNSVVLTYGISGQIGINEVQNSLNLTLDGSSSPTLAVTFSTPTDNAEFVVGENVLISANVETNNTTVQQVDFYLDQQLLFSDTLAPWQTTWLAEGLGNKNLQVIASDGNNLSANDNAVISIIEVQPEPSLSITLDSPLNGANFDAGQNVAISASVAATDTSTGYVEFYINGQLLSTDNVAPFTANWQAQGDGEISLSATAVDTTGEINDTANSTILVSAVTEPQAPQITLLSPGSNVFVNQQVNLSAEVTDVNNDVVSVEFFADGISLGSSEQAPYSITWQPNQTGATELSAIAVDATQLSDESTPVTVNVKQTGTGNLSCDISQIYRADGSECMGDDHPRRIIGYFTSWRTGKNGLPSYLAKDLPWDKLTHINYAFASINTQTNEIQVSAEATELEWPEVAGAQMDPEFTYKGHFNHISSLKKQYPDVKTLISVGGWAETTGFYAMTTNLDTCGVNQAGINAFNASAVQFIRDYGFDGVDVDYEYPSSMNDSGNPIDFAISNKCRAKLMDNYEVFMADLRSALDAAGEQDNRKYLLTIAAPSSGYLLRGMEDFALGEILDYVNIMSYDLHGAWNEYVGPQAALFDNGDDAELAAAGVYSTAQYQGIGYLNTAWAYQYFRGAFSPAQINIGIPYYTRGFQGVTGGVNGLWGKAALPDQTQCLPGTGANTPCGYGAQGIDNLWHDLDDDGNEIPAGSMPMWHAMNLMNADTLNFGAMPSYGADWGLDSNDPADIISGDYQYHYSAELGVSWLWNPQKQVFLSIEDETSLAQKLAFIIETGAGGMMVWEMAGDYGFDAQKGEYTFGTTLTDLAYDTFATASAMTQEPHTLPVPDEVIDITVTTRDWPAGDNNYPINPTLVISNNSQHAIPAGSEITFLMPTSTGDEVKDWDGAGVQVTESGYTGSNFKLNGSRKDFHTVSIPLNGNTSIAAGTEFTVSMVYYLPVSGLGNALRINIGDKVLGLKSAYPHLPEYTGDGDTGDGDNGTGGTGASCESQNIDPASYRAYPNFPQTDWQGNPSHAATGDRLTHQNSVWQANWWTTAQPGSDGSWSAVCSY